MLDTYFYLFVEKLSADDNTSFIVAHTVGKTTTDGNQLVQDFQRITSGYLGLREWYSFKTIYCDRVIAEHFKKITSGKLSRMEIARVCTDTAPVNYSSGILC